jgi:polysaccharide export outer membrane protein
MLVALLRVPCGFPQIDPDLERKHVPISIEDILRTQAKAGDRSEAPDLNERLRAMSAMTRYSQDYVLGPGDVIEVTVFGIEDLKGKGLTLDALGRVFLPFIEEIGLLGLTSREAEVKIEAAYESSVLKNPQVSVAVREYRSQFINVLGAVERPGSYQLTRRTFLVDALAMAGGLVSGKADARALIHRTAAAGSVETTIEIDLIQLLEQGDVRLNVPLSAGDVVSVPERIERFFYVLGEVQRPGAFEIKKGEAITLSKALASAGGLLGTAKSSKTTIMRQAPGSKDAEQLAVDVPRVLKGMNPDPVLAQNDVIFVPGSKTKAIGRGVFTGIGSVLAALVYVGAR